MPQALGNSYAKKLRADELHVDGDILVTGHVRQAFRGQNITHLDHPDLMMTQTGTLEIGNHETRNTVKLTNFGPRVSFSYVFHFQSDLITTTQDSAEVKIDLLEVHSLRVGDAIEIRDVTGEWNGITAAQLTGTFILKPGMAFANQIIIDSTGIANQSSTISQFRSNIDCTVYSTLNLHGDANVWERSTTQPGTVLTPDGTRLNEAVQYSVAGS